MENSRKSVNNGWWNFSIPNGFPPLSLYEAEKRGFRRVLYQWWRPNNCEVHGFSIICGVGPYLDTFEVHSKDHLYSKICALYLGDLSLLCSTPMEFFVGFDCLFTRKLLPNKKLIHFGKHSNQHYWEDFCLLLLGRKTIYRAFLCVNMFYFSNFSSHS